MSTAAMYRDPNQPIEERVKDLMARMTLTEKAAQMAQIERSVATSEAIKHLSIGSILSTPGPSVSAQEWAEMVDGFQRFALESRLSIPIIYGTDAVHGHNNCYGAAIFPHNIGLGATRDPDLARRIGEATATELRATGIHFTFAPCVDVCRDPKWGRCYESYGEDTEIVSSLTSIVWGLQGSPAPDHTKGPPYIAGRKNVIACMKHFVGNGGSEGVNEGNTVLSIEELKSVHMKPFIDCLDRGICTVMASYTCWNSVKMHSNHFLLTQVLKEQLGFKGFLISDWEGIDELCEPYGSDYRLCIKTSINAGIDMMHRDLAREAVRKSLVLLKNGKDPSKPFLPLSKSNGRLLVAGKHVNDLGYQCGGWTITKYGSSGQITDGTTILEAIIAVKGDNMEVIFEANPTQTTFQTLKFTSAIVVVGEEPYAECGGDNQKLELTTDTIEMIEFVCSRVPTLLILISGRPLIVEPLLESVEAFVAAWLPGSEGGGVADVIFGDYEFHGCLPRTWLKRVDQLPMNVGDSNYDPLFPFGFGLKMNMKKK